MKDRERAKVTEEDKRRMRRLAADLKETENDELVTGEALRNLIRWANERRRAQGIPPFEERDPDAVPEERLYERARSLGMGPYGRQDP